MADFLLELFSEEIPARLQAQARAQLQTRFQALLEANGLSAAAIDVQATPRRLALLAKDLPEASAPVREERRGPRVGAPDKAIEGFLKSAGLTRDQLVERDTGKGVFYFAEIARDGAPTGAILAQQLPALIHAFQWPKSQRWGAASIATDGPRWIRPLRAIVALLGRDVVSFEALGVQSGRETFGHRFMGGRDPIAIDHPGSYAPQLKAAFVVLSAEERAQLIADGAARAAQGAGFALRESAALVAENAGLTEWPVVLAGSFDRDFLQVPAEIVELTMATNQKYFALQDESGSLAPGFVAVANLEALDGGKAIIAGNERVLSARLHDARFFWEQDKAIPLADFAGKLADVVFHAKIGTLADKVARVTRLAGWLVERGVVAAPDGLSPAQFAADVARAARLAKADLTSGTVGEFPELQGVIGGHLAEVQGEEPHVVAALKQHYETVPQDSVAVAVALADRFDTLCEFFFIDEIPTGSRDPFALRRAALSIIGIIIHHGLRLQLEKVILAACGDDPEKFEKVFWGDGEKALAAFFVERLKTQQRSDGIRHDLIDAAFRYRNDEGHERVEDDIVRLLARVHALQDFIGTAEGRDLLIGYRRAANILKAAEKSPWKYIGETCEVMVSGPIDPAEARIDRLLRGPEKLDVKVLRCLKQEDFVGAMRVLARLRGPVDDFFNAVMVNVDDPGLRYNRLKLLEELCDLMHRVADFSRIEG